MKFSIGRWSSHRLKKLQRCAELVHLLAVFFDEGFFIVQIFLRGLERRPFYPRHIIAEGNIGILGGRVTVPSIIQQVAEGEDTCDDDAENAGECFVFTNPVHAGKLCLFKLRRVWQRQLDLERIGKEVFLRAGFELDEVAVFFGIEVSDAEIGQFSDFGSVVGHNLLIAV